MWSENKLTLRIFHRIFLSFIFFVVLVLMAFWLFYYRGVASSAREKMITSISGDTLNLARDVDQFFDVRESEVDIISNVPALSLFLHQADFFKTKTRRQVEKDIIDFVQNNDAIERVRIIESDYFKREPTVIDIEEHKKEFEAAEFFETVKIERDHALKDRFEAVYDYGVETDKGSISSFLNAGEISYSVFTGRDGERYLSLGKAVKNAITGEIKGVVVVDLSNDYLKGFLGRPPNSYLMNISLEASSGASLFGHGESAHSRSRVHRIDDLSDISFDLLQEAGIISFKKSVGDRNIYLVGEIDSALASADWRRTKLFLYLFFVGFTLASVVISYFLSKSIATPIRNLSDEVGGFDEENPQMIDEGIGVSEVKHLAKSFNGFIERLKAYKKELSVKAQMAAIGQTAAQIAHDIRSPLAVVMRYFNKAGTGEGEDYFAAALRSVEKLNKMADDMMSYSKARNLLRRKVDFVPMINDVISEASAHIRDSNVKLNHIVPDKLYVDVDPDKMGRVLTNLVINSIHACEGGGGEVCVEAASGQDGMLVLKVVDDGRGIEKERLPGIFDSVLVAEKAKGAGLGLSYCKQVVEAHGGNISADSEPGRVTAFTIEIPDCVASEEAAIERIAAEAQKGEKRKVAKAASIQGPVLVVDDDVDILVQWRSILKGYETLEFSDVKKLLYGKIDYSRINQAIVDYQFSGTSVDGLDVIRYLKGKGVDRIFLCTGFYSDEDIRRKALDLGVVTIIPKPIPDDVVGSIFLSSNQGSIYSA